MDYIAQLVTGKDEKENYILSLIVKKEYYFNDSGQCVPSDKEPKLLDKCYYYKVNSELLEHDCELVPFKLFSDLVVKGHAYNPNINSSQFQVTVQIGNYLNSIIVKGDRKIYYNGKNIKFTPPEKVDIDPLRFDYAYGGKDVAAIENIPPLDEKYLKLLPKDIDLHADTFYNYPRNPLGKGYIVEPNKQFIETLDLPNLEDPEDLLTPENLIVGNLEHWYKMPLPRCTDWLPSSFFPRIAYIGILENFLTFRQPLKEVLRGWADKTLFLSNKDNQFEFSYRCTNSASLGLQLPYIRREEKIRLMNMHPRIKDFVLTLPKEYPAIWVDGRNDKLVQTKPVIHTIVIEPDVSRLSIVWRGSALAIRPYMKEELKIMPFEVKWLPG